MTGNIPKLDLVCINSLTKFGQILSVSSQDIEQFGQILSITYYIERKQKSDINQGP